MGQPVVTGALLYNLVSCPRRVALDLFGDPKLRDPISAFVQMLWARGNLFEQQTIAALDIPFLDLSRAKGEEKERLTLEAMQRGEPLIIVEKLCPIIPFCHADILWIIVWFIAERKQNDN